MVAKTRDMTVDIAELRDNIANFDDFFRPMRNYLYWEPHCYNIPVCWSIRSVFDTLDGIDILTDDIQQLLPDLEHLDTLMPQLVALMPAQIQTMKTMKAMMLTMYATQKGMQDQQAAQQENSTAMGDAFDDSMNDDSFYLPPEVFDNADFKRGMENFISPDGKSVRFIIEPRRRSGQPRGYRAHQRDQDGGQGSHQGHSVGRFDHLPGRHRGHLQGHARRVQLRSVDRRNGRSGLDFHHHADHHPKRGGCRSDRRDRVAVAGHVVRSLGAALAVPSWHPTALDRSGDVRHPAAGGWF